MSNEKKNLNEENIITDIDNMKIILHVFGRKRTIQKSNSILNLYQIRNDYQFFAGLESDKNGVNHNESKDEDLEWNTLDQLSDQLL